MPAPVVDQPAAPAAGDELDDLLDYDFTLDDIFKDVNTNMQAPKEATKTSKANNSNKPDSLGIDEEIKIERKRAPIPKLDEARLLSQAGIPKLRRITKQRFKFKGKGHEYSDVARLLQHYQLWLDELYPRAKFADGLTIIEKLGHSKRMQTMRRGWINEGKPHCTTEEDPTPDEARDIDPQDDTHAGDRPPLSSNAEGPKTPSPPEDFDDDLYDATPQAAREEERRNGQAGAGQSLFISDDEGAGAQPEEDELDALLAEDNVRDQGDAQHTAPTQASGETHSWREDNFDDEMEAMAGMDDMW